MSNKNIFLYFFVKKQQTELSKYARKAAQQAIRNACTK